MKTLPFRALYNRQYILKLSFEARRCLGLRFSGFKALRLEHGGLQSGPRGVGGLGAVVDSRSSGFQGTGCSILSSCFVFRKPVEQ